MKKILYMHGGSGNHGCEAIVRASAQILGKDIVLYSSKPEEDCRYNLHEVVVLGRCLDKLEHLAVREHILGVDAIHQLDIAHPIERDGMHPLPYIQAIEGVVCQVMGHCRYSNVNSNCRYELRMPLAL